ncbi:sugar kinase [Microbacterium paludicola]|uniref:sugar kinase n=1 Tax=Microbacterium paludicola TaxID=300019 RepID=UPI00119F7671|nr:sugar kinase [Microbacterium paludicola]
MMGLGVLAVGESLGLVMPDAIGRLAHTRGARIGFGGAESNVAIGVSRLGGVAGWAGRLGADSLGDLITRELRAENVEVHVALDPDAATAMMVKERPRPGSTRVTYYRSVQAGSRLTEQDIPPGLVEDAKILHVTGITAGLGERPLYALHRLIDRARDSRTLVSFDVNHRPSLWRDGRNAGEAYRTLVRRADIVFAGDDEARLVTDRDDLDAQISALRDLGPACVVIKLGDQGAVAAEGPDLIRRSALKIDVVDTVGAGDSFVAGWLAETLADADLETRLRTAVICGALACTNQGDWEAAPTRADIAAVDNDGADPVQR